MAETSLDRVHEEILQSTGEPPSGFFRIITNAYFVALVVILLSLFLWFPKKLDKDGNKHIEWDRFIIWYIILSLLSVYALSKVNA